ncbi:MAG: chemotaxis protein CheA [Gemmatimonadaceae bacterium]
MDDLLRDFLAESAENLARLDHDVVELERDPSNTDLLNSIFRTVHTIKGTCGFLGLDRLEGVSHTAESVLDLLRNGTLAANSDLISDILRSVDVIKGILASLEQTGTEPRGDDSLVIAALDAWLTSTACNGESGVPTLPSVPIMPTPATLAAVEAGQLTNVEQPATPAAPSVEIAPSAMNSSLRINVAVLDALMNLAGELVLTRNQLLQLSAKDEASVYAAPVQQLNRITAELQSAVMKTRMQPVSSAWSKLPRMVRDIARDTGKRIELDMKGADTELDRQLVQALQDPLMHMVRNSADHGIERPDVRRAAGKSDVGTIRLNAFHEGGQVIVEITDDGAGIDPAAIRRKAIQRGLVRPEVADGMNDKQVLRFLFEPGFSTADAVTHLSGRGVGMDVVRDNVTRVGGTVDIQSSPGFGCTVRIKLPLTLAIVPALLVGVENELFAFPQNCVVELVRVPVENRLAFETLQGVPLYRLREALIPVIGLRALLGLTRDTVTDVTTLVICQAGGSRFGVVVDDVIDTQEIVVKPVGRRVRHIPCYAGCTILGDGRVIMIMDPAGIATMSGMHSTELSPPDVQPAPLDDVRRDSILLFEGGTDGLQAVMLSDVARLEEIAADRIEIAGGRHVVQYRGSLLPLVPASPSMTITSGTSRSVIVFNEGSTSFGIAVNAIHDIVEDCVNLEIAPSRPGVLGTAVIAGRATELIDVSYYMAQSRAPGQLTA